MKKITCAQLGTPECPFVAEAETAEEAKAKLMAHATDIHADKLAAMPDEEKQELDKKIDEILS